MCELASESLRKTDYTSVHVHKWLVFFFFKMGFSIGKPAVQRGGATWNPRCSNPAVASTPRVPETLWGGEAVCIFSFLIKAPGHKQKDKEKAGDWFGRRLIVVNS